MCRWLSVTCNSRCHEFTRFSQKCLNQVWAFVPETLRCPWKEVHVQRDCDTNEETGADFLTRRHVNTHFTCAYALSQVLDAPPQVPFLQQFIHLSVGINEFLCRDRETKSRRSLTCVTLSLLHSQLLHDPAGLFHTHNWIQASVFYKFTPTE